jgi:Calcineurin-like phosphoesterase
MVCGETARRIGGACAIGEEPGHTRRPSSHTGRRPATVVAVGLLLGCMHDAYRAGPVAPAPPRRPDAVRVLVFGDFGARTVPQLLVARAMRSADRKRPFDLAVELGDDLYPCGPDPLRPGARACRFAADGASIAPGVPQPDDPRFRVNEAPLEGLRGRDGAPLPVYVVLGNHDIGWGGQRCAVPGLPDAEAARLRACLSVARRTPEWWMPARHYVVDRGPVRIIAVDTNVVVADYGGFTLDDEVEFVRRAAEPCRSGKICFLAGHHPPAVAHGYGRHGLPYLARMARLLGAARGVRAFLGGHVHSLEHLSLPDLDVFVSGSTAMGAFSRLTTVSPARAQVRFTSSAWGYAIVDADPAGYAVRFLDWTGAALHCCAAGRTGPCLPVECGISSSR